MYSQNNEEEIILKYFGSYRGVFMDIGANDGVTLSNTFALRKNGWFGYLVEASPRAFERLKKNYLEAFPRMSGEAPDYVITDEYSLYNVAIGPVKQRSKLMQSGELLGRGDTGLVSTFKEDEKHRWDSLNMQWDEIEVDIIPFDELTKKIGQDCFFDLLSIDIEGMELEVLPHINFELHGTRMAVIEFNGKNQVAYDRIMLPWGFRLIHSNAENLIYAKI